MPKKRLKRENGVDGYQDASKDRIHYVETFIRNHDGIELEHLCSILRYTKGFHPATTKGYVDTLQDLEKVMVIETDEGFIVKALKDEPGELKFEDD